MPAKRRRETVLGRQIIPTKVMTQSGAPGKPADTCSGPRRQTLHRSEGRIETIKPVSVLACVGAANPCVSVRVYAIRSNRDLNRKCRVLHAGASLCLDAPVAS